jgi:hypothetical protein
MPGADRAELAAARQWSCRVYTAMAEPNQQVTAGRAEWGTPPATRVRCRTRSAADLPAVPTNRARA